MGEVPFEKKTLLTEGIMLATIPAVVYFLAYEYELGFFKAFNAPEDLVSVDITSIIAFGIAALGLYMILYQVLSSLFWYSHFMNMKDISWKHLLTKTILMFIALFCLFWQLYSFSWLRCVIYPAFLILFFIVLVLLVKLDVLPKWFSIFIFLATLSVSICQGIGQYHATNKINYTVIKDKNVFVIRKLGDYLLCSNYDVKSKTFSKTFQIIPLKEDLNLEYKNIGPLHLQP